MTELILDPNQIPDPYAIPIDEMDVSQPILLQQDCWQPWFDRLRAEEPIHYCKESLFGPYWSITKFNDIMEVETDPGLYKQFRGREPKVEPLLKNRGLTCLS